MTAGLLLILSGPSGVGKGTVCQRLVSLRPELSLSVSATTRNPRPGETEGFDYFFMPTTRFKSLIKEGAFLEWALVHGRHYGTLQGVVDKTLARGVDMLLEIDVQGARQVLQKRPDAVSVFMAPPSMVALEQRIAGRGTESAEKIRERMAVARQEMDAYTAYDYLVVNDRIETAASALNAIIEAEKCRVARGARPPGWGGEDR